MQKPTATDHIIKVHMTHLKKLKITYSSTMEALSYLVYDPHMRQSSLFCNEQTIAATFSLLSFTPLLDPFVVPFTPVLLVNFCLSTVNWIACAAGFVLK